jgi:NAD-dependent deacetylase
LQVLRLCRQSPIGIGILQQAPSAIATCGSNEAHLILRELEKFYDVTIVTQNVDDLHERAGSSKIIHLHGELKYACSSWNRADRVYLGTKDIKLEDLAADGSQLRPDIVWFGEAVPKMDEAVIATQKAEYL